MISFSVNALACFFESIIIFMFFDEYIDKKYETKPYLDICSILVLGLMITLSNVVLNLGLLNLIFVVAVIFVIMYMYNKNIKMNLILSIISVVILTVSEIIVGFMITMLTKISMDQIKTINDYQILGTIVCNFYIFMI